MIRNGMDATIHVGTPGPAVAAEAAAVLNASLGAGFVSASGLEQLAAGPGVLVRARTKRGRQMVGVATAGILDPTDSAALQDKLPASVRASLAGHRIGEFKSLAVIPSVRGRGVGAAMLQTSLNFLRESGCRYALTASWVSSDPAHSSPGLLERAGFGSVAIVPGFWAADQAAAGYTCPDCAEGCHCTAVIMVLDLKAA